MTAILHARKAVPQTVPNRRPTDLPRDFAQNRMAWGGAGGNWGKNKGGHILGQALFSLKNLWFFEEIFWATVLGTSLANFWGLFGVLLGSFLGQLFGGIVRRSANAC